MSFTITPMPRLGTEVGSLDLQALTASDREQLNAALAEHGVLVVRDLPLEPEEHVEFTRVFGEPDIHPMEEIRLPGVPEIIELAIDLTAQVDPDDAASDRIVGDLAWHSDLTYVAEPSRGSLLYAVDVPPEGGDTGFIDTARVYQAMPEDMRRRIHGLDVVHSFDANGSDMFPEVVHPIVHKHPVSGEPVLNISPLFARSIVGWSDADSRALLDELTEFATQERFTYFHRWSVGDLVIWDNWRTMHIATGHPKRYRRRMLRTTIRGGLPLIAA